MRRRDLLTVLAGLPIGLACPIALSSAQSDPELRRDGQRLELLISEEFTPATRTELTRWISFIADALFDVFGRWPQDHWQISVTPASGSGDDLIPWGQVRRADVDRIEFYVVPSAGAEGLKREWTGYHELAHLLIPYRGWGDLWFSEGLASYYQNLLQGRTGILDEQQVWQKLYEGFMRGRNDHRFDGQPLSSVSSGLHWQGGFMRVYWSGAWYFLAADTRLRQQSSGELTLDSALRRLNDCCSDRSLSVTDMVDRLDELNRVFIFRPLYEQAVASTRVPAFEPLFASLGISIDDGNVILQATGPGAELRQQILAPNSL